MNVCFITNELHPFQPGGIGRLMYNFAVRNRERVGSRCQFYFLIRPNEIPEWWKVVDYYEHHQLGTVVVLPAELSYLDANEAMLFGRLDSTEYGKSGFVRKSLDYYNGLLYAQNRLGIEFDLIEFPDYGGWGYASIAAKRAGLAFQRAQISVRLHSTAGLIHHAEPFYRPKGKGEAAYFELERQSLKNADLIVSHLETITKANQDFYGFDTDWRQRVLHEFPPIFLDADEAPPMVASGNAPDFVFSGRLQPFKRPDLFVKAGVTFFDSNPTYEGRFLVVSYGWDRAYIDWLRSLIPARHNDRIRFVLNAEAGLRNGLLANSIAVVPSNYESLCLFAYETALRGNQLILNQQCRAFGDVTYWKDRENCMFFDGSAEDLARACLDALKWRSPTRKELPASSSYWHRAEPRAPKRAASKGARRSRSGKLAVICHGMRTPLAVNEVLNRLSTSLGDPHIQVHLVLSNELTELRKFNIPGNLQTHYQSWVEPSPEFVNRLVAGIDADYLAFLTPDGIVSPQFYTIARQTLDTYPDLQIVSCHVRELSESDITDSRWEEGDRDAAAGDGYVSVSAGGAPSLCQFDLELVSRFSCMRRSLLAAHPLRDEAGSFSLDASLNGAIRAGADALVIPKILITHLRGAAREPNFLSQEGVLAEVADLGA